MSLEVPGLWTEQSLSSSSVTTVTVPVAKSSSSAVGSTMSNVLLKGKYMQTLVRDVPLIWLQNAFAN